MRELALKGLVLLSLTVLTACTSSPQEQVTVSSNNTSEQATKKVTKKNPASLEDFKNAFENAGLTITEEQEKESAIIQASSGIGYVLDDGSSVEVYEFEENEMFKSIKNNKELLGMPATIKGRFVVIVVNETTHQAEIDAALATFE